MATHVTRGPVDAIDQVVEMQSMVERLLRGTQANRESTEFQKEAANVALGTLAQIKELTTKLRAEIVLVRAGDQEPTGA